MWRFSIGSILNFSSSHESSVVFKIKPTSLTMNGGFSNQVYQSGHMVMFNRTDYASAGHVCIHNWTSLRTVQYMTYVLYIDAINIKSISARYKTWGLQCTLFPLTKIHPRIIGRHNICLNNKGFTIKIKTKCKD